jgi:hypothetical protein
VEEEHRGANGLGGEDDFFESEDMLQGGCVWAVRQGVSATVAVLGRVDVPPSLAANWTEWKEGLPFCVSVW